MTQSSALDSVDPMTIVDEQALTSCDLKSSADVAMVASPETKLDEEQALQPEDNQTTSDSESMDVTADSATTATEEDEAQQQKKRVTFTTADVVEFEPTVWTATISSDGVPVGLSNTVRRRTRRRLDSLEGERLLYRINRQEYMEHGYLEPDERLDMLEAAGHSMSVIHHVEQEAVRLNRERWESNEYDLLYQFGLGEVAIMDLDEEDELLLSQGTIGGYYNNQEELVQDEDDDDEMLEAEDDEGNPAEYYYYNNRSPSNQSDAEVRFAMEEIDSYDTRKYEEWAWDYTTDCILGDDGEQQLDKDAFDLPSLDFGLPEMSSSPTDISSPGECMIVSCGKIIGSGSSSAALSSSPTKSKSSSPLYFV